MECRLSRCDRTAEAVGLCGSHYTKARRAGTHGTGRYVQVDPTATTKHLTALGNLGWTASLIASAAGVAASVVRDYRRNPERPARKATAEAILSVPLASPPAKLVDPAGTRRRTEALQFAGWPRKVIEQRIGVAELSLGQALRRGVVTVRMAGLVERFYAEHNNIPGPSRAVARLAQRRGYSPAIAWEYTDIDNPKARPFAGFRGPRKSREDEA